MWHEAQVARLFFDHICVPDSEGVNDILDQSRCMGQIGLVCSPRIECIV